MEEFINALKEKNASLNQQAVELRKQNKDDEAVFCTVRANVYDICATVCRVHLEKGISPQSTVFIRGLGKNGAHPWKPQNVRIMRRRSA